MQVDPRIISAIAAPGGAFSTDLAAIAANYTDQVAHMKASGFPVLGRPGPGGRTIYQLCVEESTPMTPEESILLRAGVEAFEIGAIPALAAPPDIKPPADAPSSQEPEPEPKEPAEPEIPRPIPTRDLEVTFAASDFKLQSRDGMTPKVYIVPANEEAASAALQFSMRRPKGSIVEVTLRVRHTARRATAKAAATIAGEAAAAMAGQSTGKEAKEGEEVFYEYECTQCEHRFEEIRPVADCAHAPCPKCGGRGVRYYSSAPAAIIRENAARPAEKGKAQIERELGEQVNTGEIPASLAAEQAKLGGL